jgi:class 3 adenylate cyclase/tetratricopeptide (TPR) repeat protein
MKCPKCQSDNREEAKFCSECGAKFILTCPECGATNRADSKFCDECGKDLRESQAPKDAQLDSEGERKYVTVLFSDLSGYTSMSEKLDPEELKEIMSRIFGEIAQVVTKYEGFIEKFIGDAVMALFGAPKAHEDDPVRAIRASREIHERIETLSPEIEKRIGQSISMHTGINTGLVVTGEMDMEKGTHGVAGDTINLASRLQNLAKKGEILVGHDTFRQAEGHYAFEALEPTEVKGKAEPVKIYKVSSARDKPITTHRLSGLRADLIGRRAEIGQLYDAVDHLAKGRGRIFSICGDAGTGKSRLVEDFKNSLDLNEIQWLEGHAYAYSQNIPFFPLIDLLNRIFKIDEGDPPESVRNKIESGIGQLVEGNEAFAPYVGRLYSLSYPELEDVSPEFWRSRLKEAVMAILTATAKRSPTIFFLEDLHWADPSHVELMRNALLEIRQPAIVLCVYRPVFSLFTSHQLGTVSKIYQEIRLGDLSLSDAENMLESLLKTKDIPSDLWQFVQDKAEGNPFYLEELVNSLIESEILARDNGSWKITKPINESEISSTIHGLISGRLDRLETHTKRIVQEASVIGRAFLYDILRKVTELDDRIDRSLNTLERLDLIRTRSVEPDVEYMFKHPLTQEVVYNGLLKKDRQGIHEQIATVMEQLFQDRLVEFYETLAFHFKQSQSVSKAVEYLMKSGDKSVGRYAVEEAHQYYQEAFSILSSKPEKTVEEKQRLIDLIIRWALVFYHRGDFGGLDKLLSEHEDLAGSLDDKQRLGMFYAWFGFAIGCARGNPTSSYKYLTKALKLGEEIGSQQVIGYACTWLLWTCTDWGRFDEAISFGERAQEIAGSLESDHYLFYKSLAGLGQTYWYKGEGNKVLEIGKTLLDYGKRRSSIRSLVVGHIYTGTGHLTLGDPSSAIDSYKTAIDVAADPFYAHWSRIFLGTTYASIGQLGEAEEALQEIVSYCEHFGCEFIRPMAAGFLGAIKVANGHMSQGMKMMEDVLKVSVENERTAGYARLEYLMGKVYLQAVQGEGAKGGVSMLAKNIGFILKEVPFAAKKAEEHFNKAIEVSKEIGAKSVLGNAYEDLGLLHRAKGRTEQARKYTSNAIDVYQECKSLGFLKQAKETLAKIA